MQIINIFPNYFVHSSNNISAYFHLIFKTDYMGYSPFSDTWRIFVPIVGGILFRELAENNANFFLLFYVGFTTI